MSDRHDPEPEGPGGRGPSDGVRQEAQASDQGRSYQAGRDQNNTHIETQHVWGPGSGPAPRALASLPPAPRLTGREQRTDELLADLAPDGAGVTVVTGLPGVGKTALALHAAHRAVGQGHFPGGTLFVPLRGYDPAGAVSPEQALESLLRALGVRDGDLPPTVEEQAGLYQSELARRAEHRGTVLIVADDASSPAQLRHLVPAHPGHRLLATSRDALTAPDLRARLLPLDELDAESATTLIATALTQVRPADSRAGEEPQALEQVAGHCGRLPLALTIAAALLTDDPGLPIAALAEDLADARTRLKTLQHKDGDGRSLAVQAAFDLSYRRLRKPDARLFRLLSLNPGPDLSLKAATALNGREERETRGSLAALVRACLINEQPTGSGRWRAHDLIRLYAAELPEEEREGQALGRLLAYYTATCDAADDHLRALPGQPVPELFTDRTAALTWLDAERANLIAMIPRAVAVHPRTALYLAGALNVYLHQRRHFHDALANNESALAMARELGDRYSEGGALMELGLALQEVRRFDDAIDVHTQAIAIFREHSDRHGEGQALNNLGLAFHEVRLYDDAIQVLTEAAAIHRELGDRHGEGQALNNLGLALRELRRYDDAIAAHIQDLDICRELGDRHGEGQTLNNLGNALRKLGRHDDAVHAHDQAIDIFREHEDRYSEGQSLNNLGNALHAARRHEDAVHVYTQAIAIFREFDDHHSAHVAQRNLEVTLLEMGRGRQGRWWRRWIRRRRANGPEA
ncbi:tetratricopeptide repeat protein [Streptomyces sp. NBC_01077]|uniref:tetratricopeptide repeat protein n=1 Tax=Streptomyces sp. NBC_01077 TaxID=2903746 RepID=UPI0038635EBC|nr:tetratricopeptide repeat protein [Streptomyces sp. NBC_01077]